MSLPLALYAHDFAGAFRHDLKHGCLLYKSLLRRYLLQLVGLDRQPQGGNARGFRFRPFVFPAVQAPAGFTPAPAPEMFLLPNKVMMETLPGNQ